MKPVEREEIIVENNTSVTGTIQLQSTFSKRKGAYRKLGSVIVDNYKQTAGINTKIRNYSIDTKKDFRNMQTDKVQHPKKGLERDKSLHWRLKAREIKMNSHETEKKNTKREAQWPITLESSPRTLVPNLLVPSHLKFHSIW